MMAAMAAAATATASSSLRKVLVIVGTTGAGKTKLSIDLAKAVGGEIINSDAMQMYRGLDIATAKITEQEKEGIRHHLLDVVDPSGRCDVVEYKRLALSAIDDILARGKVPIIVGGTMYYTQAILWKSQLLDDVPIRADAPMIDDAATPEELHARLAEVDPVMARRWHVNHARRVRRSLEVFYQTGIPHSELLARQAAAKTSMEPLFDACAFWINCSKTVLADRLAKRVDKMMDTGLVDEIKRLRARVLAHPPSLGPTTTTTTTTMTLAGDDNNGQNGEGDEEDPPTTSGGHLQHPVGILQAIGYKEFAPYLEELERQTTTNTDLPGVQDAAGAPHADLGKLLESCIEQLNIATRQYARRQLSWIRTRFVPRNIPVYQVDSSDVAKWDETVATPAIAIARSFLRGEAITAYKSLQEAEPDKYAPLSEEDKYQERHCEICGNRKFVGRKEWEQHVRSKGHRYHLRRIEIEKEREEWAQRRGENGAEGTATKRPRPNEVEAAAAPDDADEAVDSGPIE